MSKFVEFGVEKEFIFNNGSAVANSIFKINSFEFLAFTNKNIVKVEENKIKTTLPYPTVAGIYIQKYDIFVYVPKGFTKFVFHQVNTNFKDAILTTGKIEQLGITHLEFSEKSDTLISYGVGIRTWKIEIIYPKNRRIDPTIGVKVTPRATFMHSYVCSSVYQPAFDRVREDILLTTRDGLFRVNLDGRIINDSFAYHSDSFSLFTVNPFNQKILTYDNDQGMCYWNSDGTLFCRYNFQFLPLVYCHFLNSEFAFILDSFFNTWIVDFKTQTRFQMMKFEEKPRHIVFIQDGDSTYFITCALQAIFYRINTYSKILGRQNPKNLKIIQETKYNIRNY